MHKFFLGILLLIAPLQANSIYEAVEELHFDPIGYFATEKPLDHIFQNHEITTVIELGSWAGASTRFIGYRVGEGGKVYAIDHWKGNEHFPAESNDPRLDHIFHLFLSNIRIAGLSDRIIPIRMSTDEAAKALSVTADMIYIDASREASQVYRDVIQWYPHLNEGGIMCGAEYREPGIKHGVQRAAHDLGLMVESDRKGRFWQLKDIADNPQ